MGKGSLAGAIIKHLHKFEQLIPKELKAKSSKQLKKEARLKPKISKRDRSKSIHRERVFSRGDNNLRLIGTTGASGGAGGNAGARRDDPSLGS